MNSRDLRLLSHIPEIAEAGIVSLKVEGRMKSEFYVATVANAYRHAIDEYLQSGAIEHQNLYNEWLETVAHRTYTDAYFEGDNLDTVCQGAGQQPEKYVFTAVVQSVENGLAKVEMRNRFKKGEELVILSPNDSANSKHFIINRIYDADNMAETDDAKLVQHPYVLKIPYELEAGDLLLKDSNTARI